MGDHYDYSPRAPNSSYAVWTTAFYITFHNSRRPITGTTNPTFLSNLVPL